MSKLTRNQKSAITRSFKKGLSIPEIATKVEVPLSKVKLQLVKWCRDESTKLWSLKVRADADNMCEVCGSSKGLQAHHMIERAVHIFRTEPLNGICLCESHHCWNIQLSAHNKMSMASTSNFMGWFRGWEDKAINLASAIVISKLEPGPAGKKILRLSKKYLFFEQNRGGKTALKAIGVDWVERYKAIVSSGAAEWPPVQKVYK